MGNLTTKSSIVERAELSVQEHNRQWPSNKGYTCTNKQEVGPFTVYNVEFTNADETRSFTNYAVARGDNVEGSYFYLADAVGHIDRGLAWRSLFVGQYATVVGSLVILVLVAAIVGSLVFRGAVDDKLWLIVSTGIGYLFGAKPDLKPQIGSK